MYESMIFYRSFYEAIKGLPYKSQAKIYNAIFAYGLDGEEPDLSAVEKAVFALVKPQIDANNKRKENGKKGAEYGKLGGKKPQDNPTETPSEPQSNPKDTPKQPQANPTETPNVNANANVNANVKEKNTKKKFVPPTREEVKAYVREQGLSVDGDEFFDYFTDTNWIDSKGQQVLSWKGKLRTWNNFGKPKPKGSTQTNFIHGSFEDDLDSIEELMRKKA